MLPVVAPATLPAGSLLDGYALQQAYVDCFAADVAGTVTLGQLITAFYNSRAFRFERWLLGALLGKTASNTDVTRLASAEVDRFSAWTVEARQDHQILLCDFQGRTRSWLMVRPIAQGTRVYFGSAVVKPGDPIFRLLLGFHRSYSRALLKSAVKALA